MIAFETPEQSLQHVMATIYTKSHLPDKFPIVVNLGIKEVHEY